MTTFTVSTNILVTGVCYSFDTQGRLPNEPRYQADKASSRSFVTYGHPTLQHVAIVLVESGLLYTTIVVVALAARLSGNNAITPMADIVRPQITIALQL